MRLVDQTINGLIDYTCAQISTFFPDGKNDIVRKEVTLHIQESLHRLERCINSIKAWPPEEFYYLQTAQYAMYLYFLSNSIWRSGGDVGVCSRLFYLNKALNGIDCFYEIDMPDIFCFGHSTGIVLAKAKYSNYLVLHQSCTIGKDNGLAPELEEGVVLYPHSAIIGRCKVLKGTVVSYGSSILNRDTPGDCLVYGGGGSKLMFAPPMRNLLEDFFRLP